MALIKCSECGKEISDKAKTCVSCGNPINVKKVKKCSECGQTIDKKDSICKKCGNPIKKKKKNIKSIIFIIIGALILTFLTGIVSSYILAINIEITLFVIGLALGLYFTIVFSIMYIKKLKKSKKKFNIFTIFSIASILLFSICLFVILQDIGFSSMFERMKIDDNIVIHVFYSGEEEAEKLFDYIQDTFPAMFILEKHDISYEEEKQLMAQVAEYFELNSENIDEPFTVINANYVLGFNEKTKKRLLKITEKEFEIYSSDYLTGEEIAYYNVVDKIRRGKNVLKPEIDNRTPKQKLIDYLVDHQRATYSNNKCNWTFTVYGLNDTFYYTLDFSNKKFVYKSYINGQSYYEYDYGSDTGYSKDVSTVGWTVTTKVNVTFDDKARTYEYKWNSSMKNMDSVAKTMASQVNDLRNDLKRYCDELEIDISDL